MSERKLNRREREMKIMKVKMQMDVLEMQKSNYYWKDEVIDRLSKF